MSDRINALDLSTLNGGEYCHRQFEMLSGMEGDVSPIVRERDNISEDIDSEIVIDDEEECGEEEGDDDKEVEEIDVPLGFVRMRPSKFKFIPGSVFFEYPKELNMHRKDLSSIEKLGRKSTLNYHCQWGRNCIKNAFKRAGFRDCDQNWTAMWSKHQAQETIKNMNCLQKVNHFPASWCIGRKDRLMRTIHSMKRLHPDEFNFHPEGFILPSDNLNLERVLKADASKMKNKHDKSKFLWIIKPCASSCGKGIKVVSHDKALSLCKEKKKLIVQRYLGDPYLINNKKFDLRMYVLVTGADPLRVYVHEEGLTRISTRDYSLKNIKDRFAHLTNYSINKKASNFVAADEAKVSPSTAENGNFEGEREGFKWSLPAFKRWLAEQESVAVMERTMKKIHDVIAKTVIAAEPDLSHSLHSSVNYRTNCFELFGFDIFLDGRLDPHLIEVNISPSLMGSSPLDKRIKGTVISDVCHIVGFQPFDNSLLSKYNRIDENKKSTSGKASSGTSSSKSKIDFNPFSFTSLSKLMAGQDAWRRDMSLHKLNLGALESEDAAWYLMLMVEDEFNRGHSSKFQRIHPVPDTVERYLHMYKNPRFSDHMLGKWTLEGLSEGKNAKLIPERFVRGVAGLCGDDGMNKSNVNKTQEATVDLNGPQGSAVAFAKSRIRLNSGKKSPRKAIAEEPYSSSRNHDMEEVSKEDDKPNVLNYSPVVNTSNGANSRKALNGHRPPSNIQRPKSASRVRPRSGSNFHRRTVNRKQERSNAVNTTNLFDKSMAYDTVQTLKHPDLTSTEPIPLIPEQVAFILSQEKKLHEMQMKTDCIPDNNNKILSPRKPSRGSSGRSRSQPPRRPPPHPRSRSNSPGGVSAPTQRVKSAKLSKSQALRKKSVTRTMEISSNYSQSSGPSDEENRVEQVDQKYRPIGKRRRRKVSSDVQKANSLQRDFVNKNVISKQISTANNIIHYRQQVNSVNVDIYQHLIQRQAEYRRAEKECGDNLSPTVNGREVVYSTNPPGPPGHSPPKVILLSSTGKASDLDGDKIDMIRPSPPRNSHMIRTGSNSAIA